MRLHPGAAIWRALLTTAAAPRRAVGPYALALISRQRLLPLVLLAALPLLALPSHSASALTRPATAADFNGDGYGDLAVGVPFETVAGAADAGAVDVLYGSGSGPTTAG